MKKSFLLMLLTITGLLPGLLHAQVAISNTAATPDASAMLDVKSSSKGILIPRTSTASRLAIVNPAKGLMIYDTVTGSFWFHNNTGWIEISSGNTTWSMNGNANIDANNNFIGTTDNAPLNIRVNNLPAGRIDPGLLNTSW